MTAMPNKAERAILRKFQSKGGYARAKKLTRKRRVEIAMMGVKARADKRRINGS